jgi:hypothetical protein
MPSKSAQLTSKALAKAKKALAKFTGKLACPILVPGPNAEWGPLSLESLEREIDRQRVAKLDLLFAHYRIPPNDKDRFRRLSACLAKDFVPGMITVEQRSSPYKKGWHKDKYWTFGRYADLVRDVDAVRHGQKIYAAICDLVEQQPKKWGEYKGRERSLETHYHKGNKILAKRTPLGMWKPSQT